MPTGGSGAWKIVARYSGINLDDKETRGGLLNKLYFGLKWWATQH